MQITDQQTKEEAQYVRCLNRQDVIFGFSTIANLAKESFRGFRKEAKGHYDPTGVEAAKRSKEKKNSTRTLRRTRVSHGIIVQTALKMTIIDGGCAEGTRRT